MLANELSLDESVIFFRAFCYRITMGDPVDVAMQKGREELEFRFSRGEPIGFFSPVLYMGSSPPTIVRQQMVPDVPATAHRRIAGEPLGVVDVLVAGEAAVD